MVSWNTNLIGVVEKLITSAPGDVGDGLEIASFPPFHARIGDEIFQLLGICAGMFEIFPDCRGDRLNIAVGLQDFLMLQPRWERERSNKNS